MTRMLEEVQFRRDGRMGEGERAWDARVGASSQGDLPGVDCRSRRTGRSAGGLSIGYRSGGEGMAGLCSTLHQRRRT